MRPMAGVVDLALEAIEPLDVGHPRVRQAAGGEHDEFCSNHLAVGSRHRPQRSRLVEHGAVDAGVELDVGPQVETIGDVVGVFQNLGLRRVALAPVPFLLQLFGERIGILHALDVAARAGIAVPIPGAADARALLKNPRRHPLPAQPVQHVHTGKARTDHDDVVSLSGFGGGGRYCGHECGLPDILFDLASSIPSVAPKRKTQIRGMALHILRGGMFVPHGEERILRVSGRCYASPGEP